MVIDQRTRVVGYQELSVAGAAVGLAVPQGTDIVLLVFSLGPIRYTVDGSTPVGGSFGLDGYDGDRISVSSHAASMAKFIRDGSVNGIVRAVYLALQ